MKPLVLISLLLINVLAIGLGFDRPDLFAAVWFGVAAGIAYSILPSRFRSHRQEVSALQSAIRKHRDQRGDDRCWMDDEELYIVLPEGYTPPPRDTAVELKNCERFIASRQNPKTEYVSPEREIERLKRIVGE